MLMGIVQFLTASYLVGVILSLYWAYLIVKKAFIKDDGSLDPQAVHDVGDLAKKNPDIAR